MWSRENKNSFAGSNSNGSSHKLTFKDLVLRCIYPLIGFLALLWFLIRVIPKPSRATYPCQRAAFPIASSFVICLIGLCGAAAAFRKAQHRIRQAKYVLAVSCTVVGIIILFFTISHYPESIFAGSFTPADPPNMPIGEGKGVFPGRVVWVHDPDATSWNGSSNFWWDDNHTNPDVIETMLSNAIRGLTQKHNDADAWEALFRHFNRERGKGNVGYSQGERIVIKPNHNNQGSHASNVNSPDTPPTVYIALLKQLVHNAGIDPNHIIISESSRYIDDKTFDACFAMFPEVRYEETNYYNLHNNPGTRGRTMAEPVPDMIVWSSPNSATSNYPLPKSIVEADYIINLARMQGHGFAGVTLAAKNWYGCFCQSPVEYDNALHGLVSTLQYDRYSPLVDLMGHRHLGGKTLLYILDGLWGFAINYMGSPAPFTYPPFDGHYPSSILVSQDPVAIDSVALDILAAQFDLKKMPLDSYLHEAALAHDPPSGVFYDPAGSGTRLKSLGVHEHWNNPIDKQYSRNLGTGPGIELVYVSPQSGSGILAGDFNADGKVGAGDFMLLIDQWLAEAGDDNWDTRFDIAPEGGDGIINIKDYKRFSQDWLRRSCLWYHPADLNRDCLVDTSDLFFFAQAWLSDSSLSNWDYRCDLVPDGRIDSRDFNVFSQYWKRRNCIAFGPADFNRDCYVNVTDLIIFSESWLSVEGDPLWDWRCDLAVDGAINMKDFSRFSEFWSE